MNNKTYNKIFKNVNMFDDFFRRKDFVKVILFPVEYFRLNEKQFNALQKTLIALKLPQKLYEVVTEDNKIISHNLETGTYRQYEIKANSILENQLYSDSLDWGIGISHEDHAILGCTKEFYEVFKSFYCQSDKEQFEKFWKDNQILYGSNLDWLDHLLKITV